VEVELIYTILKIIIGNLFFLTTEMAKKRSRNTKIKKTKDKNINTTDPCDANRPGLIKFIERWLELIEQQSATNRIQTESTITTPVELPLSKRRTRATIETVLSEQSEKNEESNSTDMEIAVDNQQGFVFDTPSIEGSLNELPWISETSKEVSWLDTIITSDYDVSSLDDYNFNTKMH